MLALFTNLVRLSNSYASHHDISSWRVGHLAANRGTYLVYLDNEKHACRISTYNRTIQWFSDHWPQGLLWPDEVDRIAKNNISYQIFISCHRHLFHIPSVFSTLNITRFSKGFTYLIYS